jgi:hypothetical protein
MKNSKLRRALLLVVGLILVVSMSVGATLAYLTYTTTTVVNTFAVGAVEIDLDEAKVDEYGNMVTGAGRVKANTYKLLPGHTYVKDPTVHVKAGSEPCYVRVLVTVSDIAKLKAAFPQAQYPDFYAGDMFLLQALVQGWDANTWQCKSYSEGTYEFWYATKIDARNGAFSTDALFETITVPASADNAAINNLNQVTVNIVAHAMQADGFATAADAWAKWGN